MDTDQAGNRTPRVFTIRAFIAGSLCSGFLAFACPYTVFLHQAAGIDADFITAGALLLFAACSGGVNSLLRWVRRSWSLEAGELVVLYTMMVVASAIPTWGLIANLLPVLPGAYYYATPENNWDELIRPHIRSWLVPQDGLAVKHFTKARLSALRSPGMPGLGRCWRGWC